jgi:fatty-acyl-CoA synthase
MRQVRLVNLLWGGLLIAALAAGAPVVLESRAMSYADLLRQHAADPARADRPFLCAEDRTLTFAEALREASRYGRLFLARRDPDRPFHVGLLLENRPEFVLAELGAGLAGAVVVGLNPTRRGGPLARDIAHADCQLVVTEDRFEHQLAEALDAPEAPERLQVLVAESSLGTALAAQPATDPGVAVGDDDLALLLFTSGTTAGPKAVRRGHGRLTLMAHGAVFTMCHATPDDAVYCAMPLFHANAQILGLGVALAAGCRLVLCRRFSASGFLPDIRRHGCTLFHYVGSPFAYIMATPERPDDADNPLRLAYGNEAPRQYLDAFAHRFGCRVVDGYGASEVGVSFTRADGDPPGALGLAGPGVAILDEAGRPCPAARFDAHGRVVNPEEAIGEIVNTAGTGLFEGYYKNEEATAARTRGGRFHTGDLGYRDQAGYVYFAGRDVEWLRVEGENFLARPVEDIIHRHPDVVLAAVYGVPDAEAGDRVMAALELRPESRFDPDGFARFLAAQPDLSPKWVPTWVRITDALHRSETNKVVKRALQHEGVVRVAPPDVVWWRPRGAETYRPFTTDDLAALREQFARAGNQARLE